MSTAVKNNLRVILQEFAESMLAKASILDSEIEDTIFAAFSSVPRHRFLDESLARHAYTDYAQPLEYGQIVSKPSVVARMLGLIGLKKGMRIFEIGSGSGYTAALMASIGAQVYGIEEVGFLAQKTRKTLDAMANSNILIGRGDGMKGWAEHAPFDAIIIWSPVTRVEEVLLQQLVQPGGKLIAPLGDDNEQTLHLWESGVMGVKMTKFERCRLLEGKD